MGISVKDFPKSAPESAPWLEPMHECTCGYGHGFYCNGKDSIHEYNPFVDEVKATAFKHVDRDALAVIYGHIDGRRVVLQTDGKEHSFTYKEFGDRNQAFLAAVRSLVPESDLFS